jgi:hypothetical protein
MGKPSQPASQIITNENIIAGCGQIPKGQEAENFDEEVKS